MTDLKGMTQMRLPTHTHRRTTLLSLHVTVLFLTLILASQTMAQATRLDAVSQESNGAPGVFLRMGVGSRAFGMGNAFTGVADDASAGYWNPAGLDYLSRSQFEFMNVQLPFDRTFNFVSGAVPINNVLTLGLSWVGLRISGIEGRSGNSATPEYFFGNSQNAFLVSLSKSLGSHLSLGGNLKIVRNTLDQDAATGLGFDAGLMLRLSNRISFGALVQDIGTDYRWQSGFTEGVPMTLRLGSSVEIYDGVLIAADVSKVTGLAPAFHLGAELRPAAVLPLRIGYSDNQLTGGLGFALPLSNHTLELNYGYASDRILNSDVHRVSLVFALGTKSRPRYEHPARFGTSKRTTRKRSMRQELRQMVSISARTLNVRSGPGTGYRKIAQVKRGQRFELLGNKGVWRKIRLRNGRTGWVHGRYLTEVD